LTDERLKILMIAPTPFFADRGCHVRIYEEARALIDLGHDVRIATYHLGRDMEGIPTVRIGQIPWYKKLSPGPSWHKPYLDILLFFKALSSARRSRPDIIHAHLHEGAFVGLLLGKLLNIPMLFDCQGSMTAEMIDHGFIRKGTLLYRLFLFLEKIVNRGADFIITSSGAGAADLMGLWGLPPGRVEGLMDGVDNGIFRPLPRTEARKALKFDDDRPTVVFLGVLNGYQGVDLLLEVVKILKERGRAPRFLIMGFPEKKYRERAESLGIADLITFTGRIDYSLSPLYLCAGDIAVSPKISLTEANGKLLNYMACGLPTLVFDNPVNREILGDAGIYAYHGDPADFAKRIEELLDDRKGREDLSRRVREKAVRDHSWHTRGERLVEIYRNIVKSPCH
jgi:glycosyltransferase involved in cell wall biosynthesis